VQVSYAGLIINPPDYSRAGKFRLSTANGFLYAIYQDASGTYRCLTYDIKRDAWCVDEYTPAVSVMYHPEQQASALLSVALYDEVIMGAADGHVFAQQDLMDDYNGQIACFVAAPEYSGGDIRAPKQWGDIFVDIIPAAVGGTGHIRVIAMSLGNDLLETAIPTSTVRQRVPLSVGGLLTSDFLGLILGWSDKFSTVAAPFQTRPTQIFAWQPSWIVQPAKMIALTTLGADMELEGYGHIRQILAAWISTTPITLTITVFDGQSPAPVTIPSSGGVYKKQYFPLSPNKGMLYSFAASSTAPFQLFLDDFEIHVGAWGRTGPYNILKNWGERPQAGAVV
jgi:hypothetical protein